MIDNKGSDLPQLINQENNNGIILIRGKSNVLLSAPHNVYHFRSDVIKDYEINTGFIVSATCSKSAAHGMIKDVQNEDDPNFSVKSEYRDFLIEYIMSNGIEFVIDIHGMNNEHNADIIIGTNRLKNVGMNQRFYRFVCDFWADSKFHTVLDKKFIASSEYNVSKNVYEKTKSYALQFEISNKIRTDNGLIDEFIILLKDFVRKLEQFTILPASMLNHVRNQLPPRVLLVSDKRANKLLNEFDFINPNTTELFSNDTFQVRFDSGLDPRLNYVKKSTIKLAGSGFVRIPSRIIKNFFKPNIDDLEKAFVGIDQGTYEFISSYNTRYVCFYNRLNNRKLFAKVSKQGVKKSPAAWLSYKYRDFLGLIPQDEYLIDDYSRICDFINLNGEVFLKDYFTIAYKRNDLIGKYELRTDFSYESLHSEKGETITKENVTDAYTKLMTIEIMPSEHQVTPLINPADLLIGLSVINLLINQGYRVDEGTTNVRISRMMAQILDVCENERVILSILNRRISCRVLIEENLRDNIIAVPQNVLNRIGISRGTVIVAKRDSWFLIMKKMDSLILSCALTCISIYGTFYALNIADSKYVYIIYILIIILIVYSSFSERRLNVKK